VVLDRERKALFIAMAGQHQIWAYSFESSVVAPFAGDRRERLRDGPAAAASFNQPCGLALVGDALYVADCEASALRHIDIAARRVGTLVGTGLFDWGDADGVGIQAQLQHPMHVAWDAKRKRCIIADSYNHKLRTYDPATRRVGTLCGDGEPGLQDASPRFYEPGGCAVVGDRCFVADTNNHLIRVVDLKSGKVSTLTLKGLEPK
jgi:DNA-binding beta-propeller fold protein YncE